MAQAGRGPRRGEGLSGEIKSLRPIEEAVDATLYGTQVLKSWAQASAVGLRCSGRGLRPPPWVSDANVAGPGLPPRWV